MMEDLNDEIFNILNNDVEEVQGDVPILNIFPSNVIVETKNKRRSEVWNHFLRISGEGFNDGFPRATCNYCKVASYKCHSDFGTTNLKNHLKKCAPYIAWKESSTENREEIIFDQKTYRGLLAKAIIRHGYSFSWVEHEGNREIHVYLNKQVKTICRNTAKSDCIKMYVLYKAKLKDLFLSLPGRVCLTSDLWTSCQTEGYMCLTAHYVDKNWKLTCRVLNFRHIIPPHTGIALCSIVYNLLQEWGIRDKIFSITLDNASSNDKMQDDLKAKLNENELLISFGDYFHIRCAAHTLNLIVKEGLKAIDDCVVKVRESVKYVKGSEARKLLFRSCVKRANILDKKGLWLDVSTRWNSTYFMLERALIFQQAFKKLSECDDVYRNFPTHDEWEMVARMCELLGPFSEITNLFSGSNYLTSNLYFEHVWKIDMFLKEQSRSSIEVIRNMALGMRTKFNKYWSEYSVLFAFASILDPRCKLEFIGYCYKKLYDDVDKGTLKVKQLHLKLETLLKEYNKNDLHHDIPIPFNTMDEDFGLSNLKRKFDHASEFDDSVIETSSHVGKTKLDIYLDDKRLDRKKDIDILSFWKDNQERYGSLALLARDILSVPITTVASESTFSIGGRILNKWKSSYIPENVEVLVATRSWLFGYEANEEEEFHGSFVDWANPKPTTLLERFM